MRDRWRRVRRWARATPAAMGWPALMGWIVGASCASEPAPEPAAETVVRADRCLVRVHGRSESGAASVLRDGYAEISPTGNDEAFGGYQWLYFPEDRYQQARHIIAEAIDAAECERVVLNGFSNGAAFVAKVLCRGETFGGRLVGVVIDDPVPDEGVVPCEPASGIDAALYWTGALTDADAGTDCDSIDFTCEGGRLIGIDAYADSLGVAIEQSVFDEHRWYRDAPELDAWLGG